MAVKCKTREEAVEAARRYETFAAAIVLVVAVGGGESAWWAVANPDDLDTVKGHVVEFTSVRNIGS